MTNQVPLDIREFLEKCTGENLDNFQVEIHDGNEKGEGFLGDFFFVSLTNKKTNEVRHLAIKQALASATEDSLDFISKIFQNETCFYESVWPELMLFQKGYPKVKQFRKISKHYAVDTTKGAEKISFENLKCQGFRNHVKTEFFKKDQLEYIFRNYGQFHAISMAYRAIDPEKFQKISSRLMNVIGIFGEMKFFQRAVTQCCRDILSAFDKEADEEVVEKFKSYVENGTEIFSESQKYHGKYHTLLHGDCWSNNMMFKYDAHGNIEDMRLIDFQLSKLATVVYDLSYCIYASGSKETFDNLDHYLRIYHQSLSEALRGYGLEPELIFPYDVLKKEWKQYCKFGLIMGLLVNSGKHSDLDEMPVLTEFIDGKNEQNDKYFDSPARRSKMFLDIGRSMILHAYNNDYL